MDKSGIKKVVEDPGIERTDGEEIDKLSIGIIAKHLDPGIGKINKKKWTNQAQT